MLSLGGVKAMKVKDLISALQKKDPELDVLTLLQYNRSSDIRHVKFISNSEYLEIDFEIALIKGTVPCIIISDE
jgi:hypothetical protein